MTSPINPKVLHQNWVHSHEEDTDDATVFRPASYNFPRARGRTAFDLKPDGSLVETGIAPTDRPEQAQGKWKLEDKNRLAFFQGDEEEPSRVLRIASAQADRLVIKKELA